MIVSVMGGTRNGRRVLHVWSSDGYLIESYFPAKSPLQGPDDEAAFLVAMIDLDVRRIAKMRAATNHRSHRNNLSRLTNAERADKYLRDTFPDRDKLVEQFAAAGRAAVARFKRRHGL